MEDILSFALIPAFAAFAFSYTVAKKRGPQGIFLLIRRALPCEFCLTFWTGAIFQLAMVTGNPYIAFPIQALAVFGLAWFLLAMTGSEVEAEW